MLDDLTEDEYKLMKKSVTEPSTLSWTTGYRLKQIESKIGREEYLDVMERIRNQNKRVQRRLNDFV
jgi:hypothetical protein